MKFQVPVSTFTFLFLGIILCFSTPACTLYGAELPSVDDAKVAVVDGGLVHEGAALVVNQEALFNQVLQKLDSIEQRLVASKKAPDGGFSLTAKIVAIVAALAAFKCAVDLFVMAPEDGVALCAFVDGFVSKFIGHSFHDYVNITGYIQNLPWGLNTTFTEYFQAVPYEPLETIVAGTNLQGVCQAGSNFLISTVDHVVGYVEFRQLWKNIPTLRKLFGV